MYVCMYVCMYVLLASFDPDLLSRQATQSSTIAPWIVIGLKPDEALAVMRYHRNSHLPSSTCNTHRHTCENKITGTFQLHLK